MGNACLHAAVRKVKRSNPMAPKEENIYAVEPALAAYKEDFDKLGLSDDDLWVFFDAFQKMDVDKSKSISLQELFKFLRVEETAFVRRCFLLFDEDDNEQIDFREFVVTLWNYCTLNKHSLILFSFDLYDGDSSGKIDLNEVGSILKEIYGPAFFENANAQRIFANFHNFESFVRTPSNELVGDGEIEIKQFKEFCDHHPSLLWPAFQIQEILRDKFGGKLFWSKLSRIRFALSDGEFLTVDDILHAHIDQDAFRERILKGGESPQNRLADHQRIHGVKTAVDVVNKTGTVANRKKPEKVMKNPFAPPSRRDSTTSGVFSKVSRRISQMASAISKRASVVAASVVKPMPNRFSRENKKAKPLPLNFKTRGALAKEAEEVERELAAIREEIEADLEAGEGQAQAAPATDIIQVPHSPGSRKKSSSHRKQSAARERRRPVKRPPQSIVVSPKGRGVGNLHLAAPFDGPSTKNSNAPVSRNSLSARGARANTSSPRGQPRPGARTPPRHHSVGLPPLGGAAAAAAAAQPQARRSDAGPAAARRNHRPPQLLAPLGGVRPGRR